MELSKPCMRVWAYVPDIEDLREFRDQDDITDPVVAVICGRVMHPGLVSSGKVGVEVIPPCCAFSAR